MGRLKSSAVVVAAGVALATGGALLASALVDDASGADSAMGSKAVPIRTGCPAGYSSRIRLNALVDDAIAAARRIVIDGKTATYQSGTIWRLNRQNTPVVQAVQLGMTPPLAGQSKLAAEARRRCGRAGEYAWAIVFGNTLSTVCCITYPTFVVRIKEAWYVF